MKKIIVPVVLLFLCAGVLLYLLSDFSSGRSSFDANAYLQARGKIDSLEVALWEARDNADAQLAIRNDLDVAWQDLNALRQKTPAEDSPESEKAVAGISKSALVWVVGGALAVLLCIVLLAALSHRKKVLTQRMEALKAENRFREPKNGYENDPTIAPRPRAPKHSIIEEADEFAEAKETKVAFEDENGNPENKVLISDLGKRPQLRPTARERITSAIQSLSDVLRAPRGLSRDRTMKLRAQSHNVTGNPNLQGSNPLETSRFDKELTEKSKILQMSRRGFPASAIATQLKIPQEQVEAVIKSAME
ncbi:MAG: hypothetical protein IKS02_00950 [Fibrobacter sp.]|nr:hypothetical protein [Fibrobacter sp.]